MKFLHVTDLHIRAPGEILYGLNPAERLRACIASINALHGDAEFAVFTGDLTDAGQIEAYQSLQEMLAELPMPYHLLLGNHDNRLNFQQVFQDSPRDANGFVQFTIETAIGRFVCLDTNVPGESYGHLCEKRLGWLEDELESARGTPVYLFMHHPPFEVGIRRMDTIPLRDTQRLAELARANGNIRHLFFGHLHRPLGGSWHGIPFTSLRGTNHQVALDFVIEHKVPGSHEPPAYGIVFARDGLTVVHAHDFLDPTNTFLL